MEQSEQQSMCQVSTVTTLRQIGKVEFQDSGQAYCTHLSSLWIVSLSSHIAWQLKVHCSNFFLCWYWSLFKLYKLLPLPVTSFKPHCCPSFLDWQLYDQDWQVFSTLIYYRPSCIEYIAFSLKQELQQGSAVSRTSFPGLIIVTLPPKLNW